MLSQKFWREMSIKAHSTNPPQSGKRKAKPPAITSPQLAKASAHPVRVKIMAALTMRTASCKELEADIGEKLNTISYHMKVLKGLGCVELVKSDSVQGGRVLESFFRATQRPYMSTEAWDGLSESEKHEWVVTTMRLITEDVEKAMEQGTFLNPDDNVITRSPMVVDAEGWAETIELLDRTVDELIEVETRSAVRLKGSTAGEIFQKVEILQFRSPYRV